MIPGITAAGARGVPGPGPSGPFRHWRILCTATMGAAYFAIQEIEMYAGGATNLAVGKAASASTSYFSNPPAGAVDGNYTEYGTHCWISDGNPMPQWWAVDLGSAYALTSVVIFPQNYSEGPSRSPVAFKVQASSDGAEWSDVASFAAISGWSAGEGKTFAL